MECDRPAVAPEEARTGLVRRHEHAQDVPAGPEIELEASRAGAPEPHLLDVHPLVERRAPLYVDPPSGERRAHLGGGDSVH